MLLKKLGLSSAAFTALGVISKNDYNKNVEGYGIQKNSILVKSFFKLNPDISTMEMVELYCKEVAVEKWYINFN